MNYEKANEPLGEVQKEPWLNFIREASTDVVVETREFEDHVVITKITSKHIETTTKLVLCKNCFNDGYQRFILKRLGLA